MFHRKSQGFLRQNLMPAYIPHAKAWGLGGKIDNRFQGKVTDLLTLPSVRFLERVALNSCDKFACGLNGRN